MFTDKAKISVRAGKGGDGAVTFHREKYVAAGGPDGGDGGRGGSVIFQVDPHLNTLIDFKYKRKFTAGDGAPGQGKRCSGKMGEDVIVRVPRGTLVRDASDSRLIADLSGDGPVVIAKGGRGGWGNSHFATATRQIPRFSKPGLPGESLDLLLELKLLADVGLAGFPNVGKSTLLSVVSAAKPEIANYPFTTITPVLGVVKVAEGESFVMADIPGLIEGASEGVGLGHDFLRHIERCRLIIHVVDVSGSEGRNPREDFLTINRELENFNAELASRPQIVAANKCDIATPEQIADFGEFVKDRGYDFIAVSAASMTNVRELVQRAYEKLETLPPIRQYEAEELSPEEMDKKEANGFEITEEDGVYVVDAPWLLPILGNCNPNDYESLQYFQRVLKNSGIIDKLEELGVGDGDTVRIGDFEFDYVP